MDAISKAAEWDEQISEGKSLSEHEEAAFDALAPSKRKEFVRQVEEAKAQETRERRIAGIVAKLPGD